GDRRAGGSRPRHDGRARAAGLRRRTRDGGERLGGHQPGEPRPPARRHRLCAADRAAVPVRRGVRRRGARAPVAHARGGDRGRDGGRGRAAAPMSLAEVVSGHRIVVSAGSGGGGKTTVAASLSLWGALGGRRTVVLTIDPARRPAAAPGLETPRSVPHPNPAQLFPRQGLTPARSLSAMMLDQKGAWDALVERHSPPEARARILENPFYQHLSQTFAGSQEYMAIEQLCLLAESGDYDLIVVDTPPTRHALDFLEAP